MPTNKCRSLQQLSANRSSDYCQPQLMTIDYTRSWSTMEPLITAFALTMRHSLNAQNKLPAKTSVDYVHILET